MAFSHVFAAFRSVKHAPNDVCSGFSQQLEKAAGTGISDFQEVRLRAPETNHRKSKKFLGTVRLYSSTNKIIT